MNDLEDEVVLFFHPDSEKSRAAALASHNRIAARTTDLSPAIPMPTVLEMMAETRDEAPRLCADLITSFIRNN